MFYNLSVVSDQHICYKQALLETNARQTLTTALVKRAMMAHVSTVLRRHFVNVQLGRWDLIVTKVGG